MSVEIVDVAPGLWLWRQPHPDWDGEDDWRPEVASFAVRSHGTGVLLDPLAPPPGPGREVYDRIDELAPEAIVVIKPDHIRDVDLFARWYGAKAYGPHLYWRGDVPATELEFARPGDELPGAITAHDDGRNALETPLYLPEQRALVFADGMTAPEGELRIWATPWHEQRVVPVMRDLLALPFELVLVAHGAPVHDRAAFEAALEREPWGAWTNA